MSKRMSFNPQTLSPDDIKNGHIYVAVQAGVKGEFLLQLSQSDIGTTGQLVLG